MRGSPYIAAIRRMIVLDTSYNAMENSQFALMIVKGLLWHSYGHFS
jgi:hypothetical protein